VAAGPPTTERLRDSEERLARYVAEVRAMILAQKRYPRLARKRSIEGAVEARIEIGADGSLSGLRLSESAPRVLSRATEEAIERAAPFPTPPEGVRVIEIPVDYSLLDAS
jgi:protein TonB